MGIGLIVFLEASLELSKGVSGIIKVGKVILERVNCAVSQSVGKPPPQI